MTSIFVPYFLFKKETILTLKKEPTEHNTIQQEINDNKSAKWPWVAHLRCSQDFIYF